MVDACVIELLGGLRVHRGGGPVTRFRTQRTGALLAYLAYHLDRQHAREELADLFWPEADFESGRMSLRTALSSLRRQLEPPGARPGSVLIADRAYVRLNPVAVSTDVQAMESAAAAAERTDNLTERITLIEKAVALYRGPLLPGVYDDWAVRERERLQMRHLAILMQLSAALEQAGEYHRALEAAHRAATLEPLAEEAHCALMRLYAATGQPAAVTRQYREFTRLMRRELKAEPGAARELYARLTSEHAVQTGASVASALSRKATPLAPPIDRLRAQSASDAATTARPACRLPIYLTPFFGREHENARILAMLRSEGARLVTLTGSGGSGKTRLAVHVAHALVDEYQDAVWFVPLAEVVDAALVLNTIVRAMDLPPSPDRTALDMLCDALGYRRSLLVLDNYEQLAEEGALIVSDLLKRIPTLSCLVTSRQRLEVSGERDYPLSALPVPDMPGAPEWLSEYASIRLFVDRARAARPDFQLTAANSPAVAALCERLEGIPLALELAAAWSQVLTPSRMLARLDERGDLLSDPRRDVAPRHRTLRATFEWSYQLLSPELRRLFAWLSVFRGGWNLEAAERVCARSLLEGTNGGEDTLMQMRALEARSLVLAVEAGEEMRFRMLETLREYAGKHLLPEDSCVAEARQTAYFLWLAEEAETAMAGPEQAAWIARLDRDLDNLRVVLERLLTVGDAETGLRLATTLTRYWQASGGAHEGLRWLESLLAAGDGLSPQSRARALCELGELLPYQRVDNTMQEALEESLRIYTELGDEKSMATVLRKLSGAVQYLTRSYGVAVPLLERSLALCRRVGDMRGIAESLRLLGSAFRDQDQCELAETYYDQSLCLYREIDDPHGVAAVSAEIGYMLQGMGQYDRAELLLHESLALSRMSGNKQSIAHILWLLGRLAQDRGRFETATDMLDQGLALALQTSNRQLTINCLVNLGLLAAQQNDHITARRRYADALVRVRELGNRRGLILPLRLDGRSALECGDYQAARDRFRECLAILRVHAAPRAAIDCLESMAQIADASQGSEMAVRLLGAGDAARHTFSVPITAGEEGVRARVMGHARAALEDQGYQRAWDEGSAMSLEQAIEMVLSTE